MLSFQLSEIDVEPQDKSLPIYKQFAKPPYWWLFSISSKVMQHRCNLLWCDESINWLASCVWLMYNIDIEEVDWNWKKLKNVVWVSKSDVEDTFQWWVDTKVFILKDDTTLDEIKSLWFENKHLKDSDEYNRIMENYRNDESVIF